MLENRRPAGLVIREPELVFSKYIDSLSMVLHFSSYLFGYYSLWFFVLLCVFIRSS